MTELARTFHHAFRRLARRPGFTAAAVATLALGIGVNLAVFSAIQAVLLAPLPYPEPDRLVEIRVANRDISAVRRSDSSPPSAWGTSCGPGSTAPSPPTP